MSIVDVLEGRARWCVEQGDCLSLMASIPDKSLDHVISDPPFELEAHTKQRRSLKDATQKRGAVNTGEIRRIDGALPFPAITEEQRCESAAHWARITKRWCVAFCQIEAIANWRSVLTGAGLEWVRGGIWRKPDGMPQFTGDRPGQGFESLAIAHQPGRKRWNGGGRHAVWTFTLDHGHGGGVRNEHPTQKPIALMMALVSDFTDPGDVVVDPFAGSGTTGIACLRLGRRFIGFEIDEGYARLASERLTAEENGSTLQASRAGQASLFGGAR